MNGERWWWGWGALLNILIFSFLHAHNYTNQEKNETWSDLKTCLSRLSNKSPTPEKNMFSSNQILMGH